MPTIEVANESTIALDLDRVNHAPVAAVPVICIYSILKIISHKKMSSNHTIINQERILSALVNKSLN